MILLLPIDIEFPYLPHRCSILRGGGSLPDCDKALGEEGHLGGGAGGRPIKAEPHGYVEAGPDRLRSDPPECL